VALAQRYRTARLTLRPVVSDDEAAVVAGVGDLAVSGWLAVVPHPYSASDFAHFLADIAFPGETFAIEADTGFVGIMSIDDGILGYWLSPDAQGKGYATEAARCLASAHFAAGGDMLTSGYFEGNVRSANVLEKLGFVEVGRDVRHCRARAADLPHVVVALPREAFV
jgi:RimJ/RimL family protein N-acetyltransferase